MPPSGIIWAKGLPGSAERRPIGLAAGEGGRNISNSNGETHTTGNEQTLDLWPIGNCQASALIDRAGRMVWGCVPRVDGDPVFSALLDHEG